MSAPKFKCEQTMSAFTVFLWQFCAMVADRRHAAFASYFFPLGLSERSTSVVFRMTYLRPLGETKAFLPITDSGAGKPSCKGSVGGGSASVVAVDGRLRVRF